MLKERAIDKDIRHLKEFIDDYWSKYSSKSSVESENKHHLSGAYSKALRNISYSYFNTTSNTHNFSNQLNRSHNDKSMNDVAISGIKYKNRLIYIETKHWLDLMTLTVDGMVFFINFILSCYMIYRICNIVNQRSNDVFNSLLLHKSLIGILIGFGLSCFDIFLIFSTSNHPLYKSIMRKIQIDISWSSLCFLKLNFKEIMTTCYLYYMVILMIVLLKIKIIPHQMNKQWKIFLAFLHGIPWIIVFLVQLLLYIVGTFQDQTKIQKHRRTNCNFLIRDNFFSLFFESLLISFPMVFSLIIIFYLIVTHCKLISQSNISNYQLTLPNELDQNLVIPTDLVEHKSQLNNNNNENNIKEINLLQHTIPITAANDNSTQPDNGQISSINSNICANDKPLILSIAGLLITCELPSIISRLTMNFYWILKKPTYQLNFIYAVCCFISICLYALHPLLVLIYVAWRDGVATNPPTNSVMVSSNHSISPNIQDDSHKVRTLILYSNASDNYSQNIDEINNYIIHTRTLQSCSNQMTQSDADNLKYLMSSV